LACPSSVHMEHATFFVKKPESHDKLIKLLEGPFGYVGLLFMMTAIFTLHGGPFLGDLSNIRQVVLTLFLYFLTMFITVFMISAYLGFGYSNSVTQGFTGSLSNSELAIGIAVGIWGIDGREVLAVAMGPLIEVPTVLVLICFATYFQNSKKLFPIRKSFEDLLA